MNHIQLRAMLREIETLTAQRRYAEAEGWALHAAKKYPREAVVWFSLGYVRQQRNNTDGAKDAVDHGLSVAPMDKPLRLLSIELAIRTGNLSPSLEDLRTLAAEKGPTGSLLQQIGKLFTGLNLHVEAEQCHRRALKTTPRNAEFLCDLAKAIMAFGNAEEAENLLNQAIAIAPYDHGAYYSLATLKKRTPSKNHVEQIETLLSKRLPDPDAEVALCYALAKELEDLGEHRRSFAALKRGADKRRRLLKYRVEDDINAMQKVSEVYNRDFFNRDIPGEKTSKPIFILGLPRSGTTLTDRILSSHTHVESLGEVSAFAGILMHSVRASSEKSDRIDGSAEANLANVGNLYTKFASAIGTGASRFIDKTPLNFAYLGAIARALPNATIIHVRRHPMDVCYAIYKTLFNMAYFCSYDLSDLARYYLAYDKLMAHWRAMLPGRIVEVCYEDIVADQETVTRRLVADCGLEWENACLSPERNTGASLTASAAQVRQKVYSSSVGLWRAYENELQPLVCMLREGGIAINT